MAPAPALRMRLVGRFAVERDGVPIDPVRFGSRKGRLLLELLAARRGHVVAMDDIVDVLWDGAAPPAKADANVATLASRLRGALGANVIVGSRAGYRLLIGPEVTLDVDDAERLAVEAERRGTAGQPALALTAADRALDILSCGPVLEDEPGADWAVDVQRLVDRLSRRARVAAWRAHLDLGEARAALAHAVAGVDADVLDEEAHRAVIVCYHRLGEQGEALRAYERLRTTLRDELGASPGPETEAVFAAVLRGDAAVAASSPVPFPAPSTVPAPWTAPFFPSSTAPSTASSRGAGELDFVGRERELGELLDLWARAARGASSAVLVSGHGGIGKTRLATELAGQVRATGATVLWARCYETERSLFLQPIVEVVREATTTLTPDVVRHAVGDRVRSLTTLVPELATIAAGSGPDTGGLGEVSEIERRRAFEAVAQLLSGLARACPLLVVLDDLHLAGASSVELLHFALRWDPGAPLLVLATVRADEADAVVEQLPSLGRVLPLEGLPDESIRLLAERAGLGDRAEAITSMTRGHTLFVVEAVRALTDSPVRLSPDGAVQQLSVPQSLRDAVTGRVRRCGPEVDEVLRAAVVVGSAFDVSLVAELVGISPETVVRRVEGARRAGIVTEAGDGYEFSNDLIREILYDSTPRPLRVLRHRRLVVLLADRPEAAARHAAAAGDVRLAAVHWQAAGERAARAFANREAEQLLTLALEAATTVDDDQLRASITLGRGRVRLALGHYTAASDDLLVTEQLGRALGASAVEATALTERGWAAFHARDLVQAEALAERAIALPDADDRAAILVGRVRNARGNLDGSITLLRGVADAAADPAHRAHALSCLGTALAHSDRYDEAMPVLDQAVVACRRTGTLRGLLSAQMFGAIVLANLGRFRPALAWAEQLVTDARRFDAPYYHPRALNSLAMIWRELGEPRRAEDLATEALATSAVADGEVESEAAANALFALAESAHVAGDDARAEQRLEEITPLLSDRVGFAWRIELRRLELRSRMGRAGAVGEGVAEADAGADDAGAEELLVASRRHGSGKYEALALAALGRSDEALRAAQRTGSGWLIARVGPEPLARRHAEQLAADLPADLRRGFVERGLLLRRFRGR